MFLTAGVGPGYRTELVLYSAVGETRFYLGVLWVELGGGEVGIPLYRLITRNQPY